MLRKMFDFVGSVKSEVAKIVWPSRAETIRGGVMIAVFSVAFALFFLVVDQVFAWLFGAVFG